MSTPERPIIEGMIMIPNKDGEDVPFHLNSAQSEIDDNLTGRDIIPKARQEGVSTYFLARALVRCLSRRNMRAVIISHEEKSTQRLLLRTQYMIDHMNPKPVVKNMSQNAITFPKTDSMIYIGTAGSKKFGRGDTINFLHCSEVAYWPDPKGLLAGLFQAVPKKSGEVALESTGNGKGNYFHRACMRAFEGKSRYHLHFLPWHTFEEYKHDLSPAEEQYVLQHLDPDFDEPFLVEKFGLSAGRISWRRETLEEMDYDYSLFKQEYPLTLDECFQATGSSVFYKVNFEPEKSWEKIDTYLHGLTNHPIRGYSYVIGSDVSGGVGRDNSVAQVICLNTMEQVAEYASNKIAPDTFGEVVLPQLGRLYNNAYQSVENNNHGIVTLKMLLKNYPTNLVYKQTKKRRAGEEVDKLTDYGFRTTAKSKPFLVGEARTWLAKEGVIHSPLLQDELDTYVEDENGQLGAEEGAFDDRVMALAVAVSAITRAALLVRAGVTAETKTLSDPFSLDSIIEELSNAGKQFPIRPQVTIEV